MIRFLAPLSLLVVIGLGVAFVLHALDARASERVMFKASDGLEITADVYRTSADPGAPWIVLAHMARASRGEYREIAARLNALGFNAIALDQRSGGRFAGVVNETHRRAVEKGLGTSFRDARPDLEAGIAWARKATDGKVLLVGSSYSAALSVVIAGEKSADVDGVLAFSPGEYLSGISVGQAASGIQVPVFLTAAANEARQINEIAAQIKGVKPMVFLPARGGRHGASALIQERTKNADAYWKAVEQFLAFFK